MLSDPYICPECQCSALEEGEAPEGTTASYKWQYCTACQWQSEIRRYRLVKTNYGVEYYPDATFVRPDVALALRLRGRVQLGLDTEDECQSIRRSRSHAPAPRPGCEQKLESH